MNLTFKNIPPDNLSEDEIKLNTESFYNTLCRITKVSDYSHCAYDTKSKNIHIYINKN